MITLIDDARQEVDSAPYRERLQVPANKQDEIREWVAQAEQKIHDHSAESKEVIEFLRRFTYTQNILDEPYRPSTESLVEITNYGTSLLPLSAYAYCPGKVNEHMYRFEKVARLGIHLQLSPEDQAVIKRVEDYYYTLCDEEERLVPIKMLGRHAKLGLSDIEPERKKDLQEILMNPRLIFADWLGCSALRAGFTLPPCPVEAIEYRILGYVEQEPQILKEILTFGYRIRNQEKCRQMMLEREGQLEIYVNGAHHLKRLLGEG